MPSLCGKAQRVEWKLSPLTILWLATGGDRHPELCGGLWLCDVLWFSMWVAPVSLLRDSPLLSSGSGKGLCSAPKDSWW